jgi:hypothetical protein
MCNQDSCQLGRHWKDHTGSVLRSCTAGAASGAAPPEHASPAAAAAGGATERSAGSGSATGGAAMPSLQPRRSLGGRPLGGAAGGAAGAGGGPTRPERGPMLGSSPVHTSFRFSLLSSERAWHEKHTGLYNLAFIILVLSNFR